MEPTFKTLDTGTATMAYCVSGPVDAPPVILMHGWGCDSSTLRSIAAVLEQTHRVYNVDFPGFGKSPEPPAIWGVDDYADMIEALIDSEHIKHPDLLGHSFGGRVAILLGYRRSDLRRITLVDSAGVKPSRGPSYYIKVYSYKLTRRITTMLLGHDRAAALAERQLRKRASADYLAASPLMRGILSKVVNEDLCHLMPSIKAPTLLIWGADDTATPLRDARRMEQLIPDAGLVIFDHCGHYSFLDNPGQFSAVLKSFIG